MKPLVEGRDYTLTNGILKIKEGVTHIPSNSFEKNENVHELLLPSTLISIGAYAFYNCDLSSKRVIIPDSVKYIFNRAFAECSIVELELGSNVRYIGKLAFYDNYISSVTNNSNKLKLIDINAFKNNSLLNKFVCNSENNVFIEESAFHNTNVVEYRHINNLRMIDLFDTYQIGSEKFPEYVACAETEDKYTYKDGILKINDGVEIVGSFEDLGSSCVSIEMPDSVIIIQPYAFQSLPCLKRIKFSNNLMYIGEDAFWDCDIREDDVVLPNSLCSIDLSAFRGSYGSGKVLIPHNTDVVCRIEAEEDDLIYANYINDFTENISLKTNSKDMKTIIEEERKLLDCLGLLPETIALNSQLSTDISPTTSLMMKNRLINFIHNPDYDENRDILDVVKFLELKQIDISDMHDTMGYLFDKKLKKTIFLFISYGYDYKNNFLIGRAIINKMYDMIDILLILGADINENNKNISTPLSLACKFGKYDVVKYLIEKGAAINMVDKWNKKAIDYAIENNNEDIVYLINSYDEEKKESEKDLEVIKKQLRLE